MREVDSTSIQGMLGHTMVSVTGKVGECALVFTSIDSTTFTFDNLDTGGGDDVSVEIVDIVGDLSDLVGSPIVEAEEVTSDECLDPSYTWTFYRFSTVNGTVTVRWCGQSNGYYSEGVELDIVTPAIRLERLELKRRLDLASNLSVRDQALSGSSASFDRPAPSDLDSLSSEARAALLAGLESAKSGNFVYLGEFAKYDDNDEYPLGV